MILTILLIITNIVAIILLACALEHIGLLKHANRKLAIGERKARRQVAFYRKWKDRLEQDAERKQAAINEWRMVANVLREDNRALLHDLAYWQARHRVIYCAWWTKQRKERAPQERRVTMVRAATLGMGRG